METIAICDGEGTLNTPYGIIDTPDIFFQALGIVRRERAKILEEESRGRTQSSNNNNG